MVRLPLQHLTEIGDGFRGPPLLHAGKAQILPRTGGSPASVPGAAFAGHGFLQFSLGMQRHA